MNTYSRALRHLNMRDVKRKHQQKIVEGKNIKLLQERELKEIKKLSEPLKYNWRKELNEGMTSSEMFFTTLPATGDATLATIADLSYGPDTIDPEPAVGVGAGDDIDTSYYDTLVFTVIAGNGPLTVYMNGTNPYPITADSPTDTYSVPILPNVRGKNTNISWSTYDPVLGRTGYGNWVITDIRLQRRTPLNVFVSLDSPEATSFIRTDPMMSNLSSSERQKKLQDMLDAGDEYVLKMLGSNFPGTGARPSETIMPQSWESSAQSFDTSKMEKNYGDVAQNQGPSSPVKYEPGMGIVPNQGAGYIGNVRLKPVSPTGTKLPGV